ncbi:MAG: galactose mutarotase [Ruminococcaceae bacterium]|nr:galactose mutarotase [Oscillospiraceae bacterium]
MQKRFFGTAFGKDVYEYTIESDSITLSVMDLGATVTALSVPDKNGKAGDIAVGFATAQDYEKYGDNQGATIGRYANRIKHGRFEIDGVQYQIPCNDGENMLHGNNEFRNAKWELCEAGENFLCFSYTSPDGSNGFPGTLKTRVKYSIQNHSLVIDYDAVSDKKTPICLTNHLYFNLNADPSKTIYNHYLQVAADSFTEADDALIPTGNILPVAGTALDFRTEKRLSEAVLADPMLAAPGGVDHNFCLRGANGSLREAAVLSEKESGRVLKVYTDLPGIQVYSGNFLQPDIGKGGVRMVKHGAVCLETQYYPDSPNHPQFEQCIFAAGEHFVSETVYEFSVL